MKKLVILIGLISSLAAHAQYEETNQSIFSKSQKFDNEGVELYTTNLEMKNYKKLGFGVSTGGMTGLMGLNLEANLTPEDALAFGIGTGKAYNTFHLAWKRNFEAQYLSPYMKVGYANWFNSNSKGGDVSNSDILKRVLTQQQIRENKFSANFVAGGAGLEYNQLEGELSGVNFYGELLLMGELNSSVYLPTGALGVVYFY